MKRGYVYTIGFTFLVTAVFTAILAFANAAYLPATQRNEQMALKRSVLYVLGLDVGDDAQVEMVFSDGIEQGFVAGTEIFTKYDSDGQVEAYAVSMVGAGLWGTIRGYIGLTAELDRLLGLGFVEHNETPGLGGRIDELWYTEQFRGLSIGDGALITYASTGEIQLDVVTGATSTSNAVLRILNETIAKALPILEVSR